MTVVTMMLVQMEMASLGTTAMAMSIVTCMGLKLLNFDATLTVEPMHCKWCAPAIRPSMTEVLLQEWDGRCPVPRCRLVTMAGLDSRTETVMNADVWMQRLLKVPTTRDVKNTASD